MKDINAFYTKKEKIFQMLDLTNFGMNNKEIKKLHSFTDMTQLNRVLQMIYRGELY